MKKWNFWNWTTLAIFALLILFIIYPTIYLFISSFRDTDTGAFTLGHFYKFFSTPYYYQTLINSIVVSITATIVSVALGAPMAYLTSMYKIRGKRFTEVVIILSMLSPPFIGAYSWVLLLGRSGWITKFFASMGLTTPPIYGFWGIILVLVLHLYPFIYLYVSGALKKVDMSLLEAAEGLGCTHIKRIITVVIPLITPTMLAGALLVFMSALADFGTPMLIGEGYRVMTVVIYGEFIGEVGGEANFAAALSSMMMILTTGLFLFQRFIVDRKSFTMNSLLPIRPVFIGGFKGVLAHLFLYSVILLSALPLLVVAYTSFLRTQGSNFVRGFSLQSYQSVFRNSGTAIFNTFFFSLIAIIIIVALGVLIAYISIRKRSALTIGLDTLAMLPYIIPGSVLGITLLMAFNKPPIILSGTITIIIVSYVLRRLPYTLRSSAAILQQLSPSIEEASISLGAPPLKTFIAITFMMMLPGVLSGAILSWITVINELSASVILYTGLTRTMSVAVYSEVIRASYGTAAALSTILTASTGLFLAIFFKIAGDNSTIV